MSIRHAVIAAVLASGAIACSNRGPTTGATTIVVAIEPSFRTINACASIQLSAAATDGAGTAVSPDSVRWTSSDATTASISSSGMLHALKAPAGVTITVLAFRGAAHGTTSATFAIAEPLVNPPPTCTSN